MNKKGGDRKRDSFQSYYVCGQCRTKIFHLQTEEPVVPCPECGWAHRELRKYRDMPTEIKLDLTNYG